MELGFHARTQLVAVVRSFCIRNLNFSSVRELEMIFSADVFVTCIDFDELA